jgi:hypothetical protein
MSRLAKVCVVMGDDRHVLTGEPAFRSYPSLAYEINRLFCESRSWDFRYERYQLPSRPWGRLSAFAHKPRQHRAASWIKLLAVYKVLELGYDFVVWIDSDCIFYDHDANWDSILENFDQSDLQFLSWVDRPFFTDQFCAGFFVVRNSDIVRRMLVDLWNDPSEYSWKHVFEQSALNRFFKSKPSEWSLIIDEPMFQLEEPSQKLLHIASFDHEQRVPTFQSWFVKNKKSFLPQKIEKHVFNSLDVDGADFEVSQIEPRNVDQLRREFWSFFQALRAALKRLRYFKYSKG